MSSSDYDYESAKRAGAKPDSSGHWPSRFKKDTHPRLFLPSELGMFNTKTSKIVPLDTKLTPEQRETVDTDTPLSREEVSGYLKSQQDSDAMSEVDVGLKPNDMNWDGITDRPWGFYEKDPYGKL